MHLPSTITLEKIGNVKLRENVRVTISHMPDECSDYFALIFHCTGLRESFLTVNMTWIRKMYILKCNKRIRRHG